jgi:Helix-turn-helix
MSQSQPIGWPSVMPRIFTSAVAGLTGFLRTVFDAEGELRSAAPTNALQLLGRSQSYLADAVAVNRSAVVKLESGKREPHEATLTVLMTEMAAAGIVFTERGVEFRKWPPKPYVPTGIKLKKRPI